MAYMVGTAKNRLTGASSEVRISQTFKQFKVTNPESFQFSNLGSRKGVQHGNRGTDSEGAEKAVH